MAKNQDKRALQLCRKLNRIRHTQAKKIDILCNDIVLAHTDFVKQLANLTFCAGFYEAILGQNELTSLLNAAADFITSHLPKSNIAIFLLDSQGFEFHIADDARPIDFDVQQFESYFTPELAKNISNTNLVCSLQDMFEMGMQGNLNMLGKISVAAIPLGRFASNVGFILAYRYAPGKLASQELEKLVAITPGLAQAIKSCRSASPRTTQANHA